MRNMSTNLNWRLWALIVALSAALAGVGSLYSCSVLPKAHGAVPAYDQLDGVRESARALAQSGLALTATASNILAALPVGRVADAETVRRVGTLLYAADESAAAANVCARETERDLK